MNLIYFTPFVVFQQQYLTKDLALLTKGLVLANIEWARTPKYVDNITDNFPYGMVVIKAILRDLLISAPSIYILINKFSNVYINR